MKSALARFRLLAELRSVVVDQLHEAGKPQAERENRKTTKEKVKTGNGNHNHGYSVPQEIRQIGQSKVRADQQRRAAQRWCWVGGVPS